MYKRLNCFIILPLVIFSISCGTPVKKTVPVNTAVYEKRQSSHNGKAVITEIVSSKNDPAGVNGDYMNIHFNFIPSAQDVKEKYICSSCSDSNLKLYYDNRESFHKNWILKWQIKPGREYPAIRHEYSGEKNKTSVSYEVFLEPGR